MNNPLSTYINIEFNGYKLHATQDNIIDLHIMLTGKNTTGSNASSSNSKMEFNLYDDTALLLEDAILKVAPGKRDIKIQFGYVGGKSSDIYTAMITSLSTEFTGRGVNLSCEAIFRPQALVKTSIRSYEGLISDIVAQIASEEGWELTYNIPTKPIYVTNNGQETQKIYRCENENPLTFIQNKLIPDAVTADGAMGNYEFSLDTTKKPPICTFAPKGYESKDAKVVSYTYYVGKSSDRIISFKPEYNERIKQLTGASGVEVKSTDPKSGEPLSYKVLSDGINTPSSDMVIPFCGGSKTLSEIQAIAENLYAKTSSIPIEATLELIGDPSIKPLSYIQISVLLPNNVLHLSSGKYLVQTVDHNVGMGAYTTSLKLVRLGSYTLSGSGTRNGTVSDVKPPASVEDYEGDVIVELKYFRSLQRIYAYNEDGKAVLEFECRSDFEEGTNEDGYARATLPNGVYENVYAEIKKNGTAYGTFYITTGDARGRDIHGGGSGLTDPYASRQGWVPTYGCLRMQNEDGETLSKAIIGSGNSIVLSVSD